MGSTQTPTKGDISARQQKGFERYMTALDAYPILKDVTILSNEDSSSWPEWQQMLFNETRQLLSDELKAHLMENGTSRRKMDSINPDIWKDPQSGTMKLTESPRPVLGYLPKSELKKLNEIVLTEYKTEIERLRALIMENQAAMRASDPDKKEVEALLSGESFLMADVVSHRVVSDHWEDLAANKVPIIEILRERELFLQECQDFENKATGDGTRYTKENSLKIEDENKFRAFAYDKIKKMDSEAIAECRRYHKETGRLFEIDGIKYLEMIKEQKFGRVEEHAGGRTLTKLPFERISQAQKQKFSGFKVSNLVPEGPSESKPLRVSLYELGIETNSLVTNGPEPDMIETMDKGGYYNQSINPLALGLPGPGPYGFLPHNPTPNKPAGLPDCVTADPDIYKVACEIPNARMIEMTLPAGASTSLHEHVTHYFYCLTDANLEIQEGDPMGEPQEMTLAAGTATIIPAGPIKMTNPTQNEFKAVFVEPMPTCKPCGDVAGFISPFVVAPQCYKVLVEDDEWVTGLMTMEPGAADGIHHHKDHLIYVLAGDQLTVNQDGKISEGTTLQLKLNVGLPAPMAAPLMAHHSIKNTGKETCMLVFFETKK